MAEAPIKMLSIDDHTFTTDLDRAGYRKKGIQVLAASSYPEAVQVLMKNTVDVLVLNMDCAGIDAEGTVRQLVDDERWAKIPIVATSVRSRASLRYDIIEAGASLFVEQPIPRDKFIESLKSLLQQETRSTERVSVHGSIKFAFDGEEHEAPIADLSASGVLINTEIQLESNTSLSLTFKLSGDRKLFKIVGSVARTIAPESVEPGAPTGVGVRFEEFDGDAQARLRTYLAKNSTEESELLYYL